MIDTALMKLASLAMHLMEYTETGHPHDLAAAHTVAADPEVVAVFAKLDAEALLPLPRSPLVSWAAWRPARRTR